MVDRAALAGIELFQDFPAEAVDALAAASHTVHLRREDVLFHEGDEASELYVVASGRIAIANVSPDGKESVVALMEQNDAFGELPLFDGGGRSAQAKALEPSTVVTVPYAPLQQVLEAQPALLWEVVQIMAQRLRVANSALADAMFLDVTGRTAKRLLELAGDADEFRLPVTQEELAGMIGASRERVNKALSSFIRLGWVEQNGRRYVLKDRDELQRRAR
jgi:CRP-like cAMP-binding protein